ncbi:hypothetical protein [Promicromonospora sp. NPDC057488]|uniref:hypothetical protein n=1 Tax=Promicromonospora sp. NPDC057488 TaxID=3346147 RepID=UPI00367363BD
MSGAPTAPAEADRGQPNGKPTGKPTDGWTMLLPPGWARFPTGEGRARELDAAIEQVVARALPDSMPRDRAEPYRHMLRDELRKTLAESQEAGTGAVYLPTEPMDGVLVPATIAEVELVSDVGQDPLRVVTSVLSGGYEQSDPAEVDGRPAVRVVQTKHNMRRGPDWPVVSTRQVLYVVSRDEAAGEWLVLSFSTLWNSEKTELLAEALVLFFDALMTTFRWAGPGTRILNLPERSVPGSA